MLPHPVAVALDVDDVAMVRHDVVDVAPRAGARIENRKTCSPNQTPRNRPRGRIHRAMIRPD